MLTILQISIITKYQWNETQIRSDLCYEQTTTFSQCADLFFISLNLSKLISLNYRCLEPHTLNSGYNFTNLNNYLLSTERN